MKWMLAGEVREELPEDFQGKVIDVGRKADTFVGQVSCYTILSLIQSAW